MRHPDLDSEYEAQPSQVPHLEHAGWKVVEGQAEQGEIWPEELQRFEGQEQVRMRHPELPGQQITIARSAVPMHQERGWYEVPDENAPTPPAGGPESDAQQQAGHPSTPPVRQRPSNRRRSGASSKDGE
jgi:hypothetical protein